MGNRIEIPTKEAVLDLLDQAFEECNKRPEDSDQWKGVTDWGFMVVYFKDYTKDYLATAIEFLTGDTCVKGRKRLNKDRLLVVFLELAYEWRREKKLLNEGYCEKVSSLAESALTDRGFRFCD